MSATMNGCSKVRWLPALDGVIRTTHSSPRFSEVTSHFRSVYAAEPLAVFPEPVAQAGFPRRGATWRQEIRHESSVFLPSENYVSHKPADRASRGIRQRHWEMKEKRAHPQVTRDKSYQLLEGERLGASCVDNTV